MKDLDGRVAIITGAASGIGLGSALALGKRGVRVLLADINDADAEEGASEIRAQGGSAKALRCDVGDPESFIMLRDTAQQEWGPADIVMNNVGVLVSGRPEEIPLTVWEQVLNVNLMSVIRSVHTFIPVMKARGEGHFVNTASFAGLFPYAWDRLPYAAGKGAIVTLSEGLVLYLKPLGIGVTCLCPGPVKTRIGATMRSFSEGIGLRGPGAQFTALEAGDVGEMVVKAIEQNRFFLPTDDLVRPILQARAADPDAFLDSQLSGFVT